MNLPASIRVGYLDYAIEEWPPLQASASERFGECDHSNLTIRVRSDLQLQRKANVLLHEVLHAAFLVGDLGGDPEERVVTVLANQMTQVWRDNPEFVAFMEAALRSEK